MDLAIKKKYMIFSLQTALTKDNRPYLKLVLSDDEGAMINGIMFDSNKLTFTATKGNIVDIVGVVQTYNNVAQLKISDMDIVKDADVNDFLPKSSKDMIAMTEELRSFLDKNIRDDYFKKLATEFMNDTLTFEAFTKMPAAKSVHHAYINGLLEHTLSMLKLSKLVADFYGDGVSRDLLLMGALFHDAGKIKELDIENGFDYTDEGKLLGHLLLGIEMVQGYILKIDNFPKKSKNLVLHLIASHHGLLEYGSPKRPKTKEAFLLHYIDNMDAKMQSFDSIFAKENVLEGGWSNYDRLLERPLYNHGLK